MFGQADRQGQSDPAGPPAEQPARARPSEAQRELAGTPPTGQTFRCVPLHYTPRHPLTQPTMIGDRQPGRPHVTGGCEVWQGNCHQAQSTISSPMSCSHLTER